jgi:hypothetical protein
MIKEVIMVLAMTTGTGNAGYGSESVTAFTSIESCKTAIRVFRSSKSSQYNVVNSEKGAKFTENVEWAPDRHYELTCIPLSDDD